MAHRDLASRIHVRNAADCVAKLFAAPRTRNYRIRLSGVLNRCCALVLILESILLVLLVKIVLQHNPAESGQTRTDANDPKLPSSTCQ